MNKYNLKFKSKLIKENINLYIFKKLSFSHIDKGWLTWINDKSIQEKLNSQPKKYKRMDLEKTLNVWKKNNDICLAIHHKLTNQYIGNVRISMINKIHKQCTFGRLIGYQSNQNKGIGTIVSYKICEYVFEIMKFNKLWTHVYTDNKPSITSNLYAGLKIEGLLKKHFIKNKIPKDVFSFGINCEDFKKIQKNLNEF